MLGGTVFMVDNKIKQNLFKRIIHIHDRQYPVSDKPAMSKIAHSEEILKMTAVMKTLTFNLSLFIPYGSIKWL